MIQLNDHLGSSLFEIAEDGKIISFEDYYAYGGSCYRFARSQTETAKRYRFNGKERDEETGLYYYGARYYASWMCRWISTDPAGTVDGLNLYQYVKSNPIKYKDENGEVSKNTILGGAGEQLTEEILKNEGNIVASIGKHTNTPGPDIIAFKDGVLKIIDNKESVIDGKKIYTVKGFQDEKLFDKWLGQTESAIKKADDLSIENKQNMLKALKDKNIELEVTTSGKNIKGIGKNLAKGVNGLKVNFRNLSEKVKDIKDDVQFGDYKKIISTSRKKLSGNLAKKLAGKTLSIVNVAQTVLNIFRTHQGMEMFNQIDDIREGKMGAGTQERLHDLENFYGTQLNSNLNKMFYLNGDIDARTSDELMDYFEGAKKQVEQYRINNNQIL